MRTRDRFAVVPHIADTFSSLLSASFHACNRFFCWSDLEYRVASLVVLLLVADGLGACTMIPTTVQADSRTTCTDSGPGRWEIITQPVIESPAGPGSKYIRVPVLVESKKYGFSAACINASKNTLFTDQSSYPATLFVGSGYTQTETPILQYPASNLVPVGFRIAGAYKDGAIIHYFFQATIPETQHAIKLDLAGYAGQISLASTNVASITPPPVVDEKKLLPNVHKGEIAGKAKLSIITADRFDRNPNTFNHPIYDRVKITLTLTNTNPTTSTVTVEAAVIDDRLILGPPVYDTASGCGPSRMTIPPNGHITPTLCSMLPQYTNVPLGSKKMIYIILSGELQEVYTSTITIR